MKKAIFLAALGLGLHTTPTHASEGDPPLNTASITEQSASLQPQLGLLDGPAPSLTPLGNQGKKRTPNPWVAAGLNWFLPGTGYLYNGKKPVWIGASMTVAAIGLTAVEQSHLWADPGLKGANPEVFNLMFASVLVMNTALAVDAFREAKAMSAGGSEPTVRRRVNVAPLTFKDGDQRHVGLALGLRY